MAGTVRAGHAAHVLRSRLQEAQRERARAQLAQWLPTLGPWLQAARHKRKRPAGGQDPGSGRPRPMRRDQPAAGAVERQFLPTTATAARPMGIAGQAAPAGQVGPAVPAWQTARRSSSSESSRDTSPLSASGGAPGPEPGLAAQGLLSAHALLALDAEERGAALAAITGGAPPPNLTLINPNPNSNPHPHSSPSLNQP